MIIQNKYIYIFKVNIINKNKINLINNYLKICNILNCV